jgi:hypothetical protein
MGDETAAPKEVIEAAAAHVAGDTSNRLHVVRDFRNREEGAEGAKTPDQTKEKAGITARRLLDRRFSEITRRIKNGATPSDSETHLSLENYYRNGFPPEYAALGDIPIHEGLEITTSDGKK